MDAIHLIRRVLEQREFPVDLSPGLRVIVRRPAEAELGEYLRGARQADTHLRCVVGWRGFSEAVWLGESVGSKDPVDFDPELWLQVARDRADWIAQLAEAIADAIAAHAKQRGDVAKNSMPSSTTKPASSKRAPSRR